MKPGEITAHPEFHGRYKSDRGLKRTYRPPVKKSDRPGYKEAVIQLQTFDVLSFQLVEVFQRFHFQLHGGRFVTHDNRFWMQL